MFRGSTVELAGAIWLGNTFERCRLVVDGLPADWSSNRVANCQLEFLPYGVTPLELADWLARRSPA
jgi:hypothetical protein